MHRRDAENTEGAQRANESLCCLSAPPQRSLRLGGASDLLNKTVEDDTEFWLRLGCAEFFVVNLSSLISLLSSSPVPLHSPR
jgi:hypothetical protein